MSHDKLQVETTKHKTIIWAQAEIKDAAEVMETMKPFLSGGHDDLVRTCSNVQADTRLAKTKEK